MRNLRILPLLAVGLGVGLMFGCSSDETEEDKLKYKPQEDSGSPEKTVEAGPQCNPRMLCERSITECEAKLTQADCEKWYLDGECKDMTAYTTCNCKCIDKSSCDDYFSCGEICFAEHCE